MTLYPDQATESILGLRLKFAPPDEGPSAFIGEERVYWTNPREESFGPFDVDKLSRNVCDTLQNVCSEEYFHFDNSTQCVNAMLSLPEGQWTSSGNYVYIGNSSICRGIHNFLARENPEAHCAHLSWPSQADPKEGSFKCDDKILNNATFEFSEEEVQMFKQVSHNYGIRNVTQTRNVDPGDLGDCHNADGQAKLLVLNALDKKTSLKTSALFATRTFRATTPPLTCERCIGLLYSLSLSLNGFLQECSFAVTLLLVIKVFKLTF
jgi:hypothetical protein